MTYEEFKAEYSKVFNLMMKYSCDQAGSSIYANELSLLSDKYSDFELQMEEELFPTATA